MTDLLSGLARHGVLLLFAVCFLEAMGLPIPAAIALLASGALVAAGKLHVIAAISAALIAFLTADLLMFQLGRRTGWFLLSFLCRLASDPDSCILTSARSFHRRGRTVLLVAKFFPGLAAMAPPMAGSMHMRTRDFLLFDGGGILLYTGVYMTLGYIFADVLAAMVLAMEQAGRLAESVLLAGIAGFLLHRVWLFWKNRRYHAIPKVDVHEVGGRIIDVRSHGYYDPGAHRIQGSVRIEPDRLTEIVADLPQDEKIYLYCT